MSPRRLFSLSLLLLACGPSLTPPAEGTTHVQVNVAVERNAGVVVASAPPRVATAMTPPARAAPAPLLVATPAPPPTPTPAESEPCGAQPDATGRVPALGELALGHVHSCARLEDGTARCWGGNLEGFTGTGTTGSDRGPAAPAQVLDLDQVTELCAGFGHSCALRRDGSVWCWGGNSHHQVRFARTNAVSRPMHSGVDRAAHVSCGAWHTCVLKTDHSVWCWGDASPTYRPARVALPARVVEVASGRDRSCARSSRDEVWCWTTRTRTPTRVTGFEAPPAQLAVDEQHACAALTDGRVACWGDGYHGELGTGSAQESDTPRVVDGLRDILRVVARNHRTCALARDGALWCWGEARTSARSPSTFVPQPPTLMTRVAPARSVALGENHACAVARSGAVCCWGQNYYGQLGNNETSPPDAQHAPSPVLW